ncbi:hypothetical protein KFK09_014474 [Dendrobium nobile]|uniref:LIM zinc-binding domain-containing protein n=1 Tax=Dendrobium nobile TaxID=94219 RepID=A0A8T3B288_DENNO|nr:hypothetical protein KFK09_014474 [Dendrobium nobile]
MGWLSKIFKGSRHKISRGQYRGKSSDDNYWNETSNSLPYWGNESEDLDHAIALSLSEEDPKNANATEIEFDVDEDEQLARALQESLDIESPPRQSIESPPRDNVESPPQQNIESPPEQSVESPPWQNGHIYQPSSFFVHTKSRICAGCKNAVGNGQFLSFMGAIWHPDCFRCYACDQPITDYEFSMYGDYPYHLSCYRDLYHPKCDVCKQFIQPNMNGLIEYLAHPFWMQKYCPSHAHDGTPRCCSCERMEFRDTKYVTLDDGRKLCLECLDSAIMDTNECQPLYIDIREFFEGLNMKVDQEIPLLLVERQALNEAMEGEKQGHHHLPETRGLCLSEEQIVSTISRRPRFGPGSKVIEMIKEPYRLTRHCEVTAILVLYGLPRLLTGSILTHEMMHAWLRLKGYRDLNPKVEEGICQVLAHMWVESEIMSSTGSNVASSSSSTLSKKGTRSESERKLGDFFKIQIELDPSPVYGDGFRAGNEAVIKYGLKTTLDHIKLTTSFPC